MAMVVRAYPLVTRAADLQAFADELRGARRDETDAFYRKYAVSHESWHLQDTPNGPWVIGVTVVDDVTAGAAYGASVDPFDAWFKARVKQLTGVDIDAQPLGPPVQRVFEWQDALRPLGTLAEDRDARGLTRS